MVFSMYLIFGPIPQDICRYCADENITSVTEIPYFDGDFWPNVIEETIKELDQEREATEAATGEVCGGRCGREGVYGGEVGGRGGGRERWEGGRDVEGEIKGREGCVEGRGGMEGEGCGRERWEGGEIWRA